MKEKLNDRRRMLLKASGRALSIPENKVAAEEGEEKPEGDDKKDVGVRIASSKLVAVKATACASDVCDCLIRREERELGENGSTKRHGDECLCLRKLDAPS